MDSSRRRFHIALAVRDLAESIADYTHRLGVAPTVVVTGKYAMGRTEQMTGSWNPVHQSRHTACGMVRPAYADI